MYYLLLCDKLCCQFVYYSYVISSCVYIFHLVLSYLSWKLYVLCILMLLLLLLLLLSYYIHAFEGISPPLKRHVFGFGNVLPSTALVSKETRCLVGIQQALRGLYEVAELSSFQLVSLAFGIERKKEGDCSVHVKAFGILTCSSTILLTISFIVSICSASWLGPFLFAFSTFSSFLFPFLFPFPYFGLWGFTLSLFSFVLWFFSWVWCFSLFGTPQATTTRFGRDSGDFQRELSLFSVFFEFEAAIKHFVRSFMENTMTWAS